jgi:hypothetical protein
MVDALGECRCVHKTLYMGWARPGMFRGPLFLGPESKGNLLADAAQSAPERVR